MNVSDLPLLPLNDAEMHAMTALGTILAGKALPPCVARPWLRALVYLMQSNRECPDDDLQQMRDVQTREGVDALMEASVYSAYAARALRTPDPYDLAALKDTPPLYGMPE